MPKEKRLVAKAKKGKKGKRIRQVAAIPFRLNPDGELQVLLITSNKTKRFIVPKGWPKKGKSGKKTAVIEAREEAGVVGTALKWPLGRYAYWKRLSNRFIHVHVDVYLLSVTSTLSGWQESPKRQRAWLSPLDASQLIDEPQLATLIKGISDGMTVEDCLAVRQ
jgi:8-oxo-dGTP pyrophosphatase MutT (NUDIX family)